MSEVNLGLNDYIKRLDVLKCRNGCYRNCAKCEWAIDRDSQCEGEIFVVNVLEIPAADIPKWISTEEQLPNEDEAVFVYLWNDRPYIAYYYNGEWSTNDFTLDKDEEPKMWMPLPGLPKGEQGE